MPTSNMHDDNVHRILNKSNGTNHGLCRDFHRSCTDFFKTLKILLVATVTNEAGFTQSQLEFHFISKET